MEQWKPAPGYEGIYEVSDDGRVKRVGKDRLGRCRNTMLRSGRRRGYLNFTLSSLCTPKTFSAHRLVWEAFNGPIPPGMQINHKNGVKRDNRLENLEVCTASENTMHAREVLNVPVGYGHVPGSKNGRATITEEDVPKIRRAYANGATQREIADMFGMKPGAVSCLLRGATWRHVP